MGIYIREEVFEEIESVIIRGIHALLFKLKYDHASILGTSNSFSTSSTSRTTSLKEGRRDGSRLVQRVKISSNRLLGWCGTEMWWF